MLKEVTWSLNMKIHMSEVLPGLFQAAAFGIELI